MGANNSTDASWGNRHVKSSADGGAPDNAVFWVGEGNFAVGKSSSDRFQDFGPGVTKEQAYGKLKQAGMSDEEINMMIGELQKAYGVIMKGDVKKVIGEMFKPMFEKHDLVAVYSEYGGKGGQSGMTLYTKAEWDKMLAAEGK